MEGLGLPIGWRLKLVFQGWQLRSAREFFCPRLSLPNDVGNLFNSIDDWFRVFPKLPQYNPCVANQPPKAVEIGDLFVKLGLELL